MFQGKLSVSKGKVRLASCISALLVCCTGWAQAAQTSTGNYETERKVYDLIQQSTAFSSRRDFAAALPVLKQAASYDPTSYSANVHLDLAECERGLKQYGQALDDAKYAFQLDPKLASALYTTALVYNDMHQPDQAIEYLHKYIRISKDPNAERLVKQISTFHYVQEAQRSLQSGSYERVIELLEKAAAADPSPFSEAIHSNLCYAFQHLHRSEPALAEAKKAVSFDPENKGALYALAIAYGDNLKFDEAVQTLRQYMALQSDPDQRAYAAKIIEMFEADKAASESPASRAPDYCDKEKWKVRWPQTRLPLKVYVASGKGVYGYKDSWASFVPSSLDAWCRASRDKLDYKIVDSPEDADIRVFWTTADLPSSNEHPGVLPSGLTEYKYDDDGRMRVKVSVRTTSPFDSRHVFEDGEVAHVCVHELGHALGMQHSTVMQDVMYFRSSDAESDRLTARDKASIARYYDDYPTLAFVPHAAITIIPKFVPPPTFMPPKPSDIGKLTPPMFVPPPIKEENEKLKPPMFVPPPIKSPLPASSAPHMVPPAFVPPPVKKEKRSPDGLFFTPPPK